MAYQNVGTPRFYVSILQWLKSLGLMTNLSSAFTGANMTLFDINPSSMLTLTNGTGNADAININTGVILNTVMPNDNNFFMVLGHNFLTSTTHITLRNPGDNESVCGDVLVNGMSYASYDGFSINTGNDAGDISGDVINFRVDGTANVYASNPQIGSLLYGTYYDMPHSPDLNLTMTREYGGIKTIETKGGASLSNDFGSSPPAWGEAGAWELYEGTPTNQALSRSGRRVWGLSFSYLDNHNLWGSNQSLSLARFDTDDGITDNDDTGEQGTTGNYSFNLLTDDNFYSQVIHKTNGNLPFIFQPDNTDANIQNFAICKFDQSSFSFQQTAPNLYSCKVRIRECW